MPEDEDPADSGITFSNDHIHTVMTSSRLQTLVIKDANRSIDDRTIKQSARQNRETPDQDDLGPCPTF